MKHGEFLWCDVMTTDVAAGAAFYAAVVGWGVQPAEQPGMAYTVLTVEGQGVAGAMPTPPELQGKVPPCWMTYVAVDDVDAAAAKVTALGGTVQRPPTDVPGVIRFAVVSDPQGAGFLIARGLRDEPMPAIAPGTPGLVGWHELYAGDGPGVFAFYEALFGWTKAEAHDMGPMGVYQLFSVGGGEVVGGIMTKPEAMPVPNWAVYFNVDAIDAGAERVKANGGKVIMGPASVPGDLWIVQCQDPQGAYFALLAPKR